MTGQESLRAAAARDKGFLGVDIVAMAQLIQQMNSASDAISRWLRANAALPPSVPRTGIRQAAAVQTWVSGQPGMLTRRRNYAVTHLGEGGHSMPKVGAGGTGGLGGSRHRSTPAGAGRHVGNFPDVHAGTRAGAADAAAAQKAIKAHRPVPAGVWARLLANSDDPDYTRGLYERLGPAGAAALIKAALPAEEHLKAVRTSLGTASHHMVMNERWLRHLLDAASADGIHDDAVGVLGQAGLDRRAKAALGHIGLTHLAQPPGHRFPAPRPPHEAMVLPAATDPYTAVELYSRHSDAVHQALAAYPHSEALTRLVTHATTAHEVDPAAVRANAERLAGFHADARPLEERA
jgi:hypothetical protein